MFDFKLRLAKGLLVLILICYVAGTVLADCDNELDCGKTEGQPQPICALEKEKTCFQLFDSECQMRSWACKSDRVYMKVAIDFCSLPEGFLCKEV